MDWAIISASNLAAKALRVDIMKELIDMPGEEKKICWGGLAKCAVELGCWSIVDSFLAEHHRFEREHRVENCDDCGEKWIC